MYTPYLVQWVAYRMCSKHWMNEWMNEKKEGKKGRRKEGRKVKTGRDLDPISTYITQMEEKEVEGDPVGLPCCRDWARPLASVRMHDCIPFVLSTLESRTFYSLIHWIFIELRLCARSFRYSSRHARQDHHFCGTCIFLSTLEHKRRKPKFGLLCAIKHGVKTKELNENY